MNAYKVYNFGRPLEKCDIQELLRNNGGTAAAVYIAGVNEKFRSEIPESLKIVIHNGVSRAEVWISDQEVTPENRWHPAGNIVNTPESPHNQELEAGRPLEDELLQELFIPENQAIQTRGRPRKTGPLSRTTKWRRQKEMKSYQERLIKEV